MRISPNIFRLRHGLVLAVFCLGATSSISGETLLNKADQKSSYKANADLGQRNVQPLAIPPIRSASCKLAAIFDAGAGMEERLNAVHALGPDLTHEELASLYLFLGALPAPGEQNFSGLVLIKNDILDILQQLGSTPAGLTRLMAGMYSNPAQDAMTRDYVLQHMASWLEMGAPDEAGGKKQIQTILEGALRENSSIAGTALLGLHRNIKTSTSAESRKIDHYAVSLATQPDADLGARITAVQVCAERKVAGILPVLESLVRGPAPMPLRLSAIAALGRLGGPDQAILLQTLNSDHNRALAPAIAAALRRLESSVASRDPF